MVRNRISKVVVSASIDGKADRKELVFVMGAMHLITGQKPTVTYAKRSIQEFGVREGQCIGCKVSLTGPRMNNFLSKCYHIVFPRLRDFKGFRESSMDDRGNFSFGVTSPLAFPELEGQYDLFERISGFNVTLQTDPNLPYRKGLPSCLSRVFVAFPYAPKSEEPQVVKEQEESTEPEEAKEQEEIKG